MWDDTTHWGALALGIIIGLVVGAPVGAAWIIVRARYRLLRTAARNARTHVGGMARILGIVALVASGTVLALVGAVAGWWSG